MVLSNWIVPAIVEIPVALKLRVTISSPIIDVDATSLLSPPYSIAWASSSDGICLGASTISVVSLPSD